MRSYLSGFLQQSKSFDLSLNIGNVAVRFLLKVLLNIVNLKINFSCSLASNANKRDCFTLEAPGLNLRLATLSISK